MGAAVAVSSDQVRRFRLIRSGLLAPFATPEAAAGALVGIQAQILPAAGVALWNRTQGLTHAGFEALLYDRRTLVKLWGQRGTLHVYPSADWPLVCAMVSGHKSWWGRTAEKENRFDEYDLLVERVAEELRRRPTLGRSDLRAGDFGLTAEHLSPWGGVFADLVRRGYACHAGREGEGRFVARENWLPDLPWAPPDFDAANVAVLRRYVRSYGPTTVEDFRYWRGWYAEPARRWWGALAAELAPVEIAGEAPPRTQYVLAEDLELLRAPVEDEAWPLHMLYRFDPLLLGHKEKGWIVPPAHYNKVWRPAGHIEGVVLVRGQAAATWRYARKGAALEISVAPFGKIPKRVQGQVEKLALGVADFFGAKKGEVRWGSE
jgi:hypothetical protein